MYHKNISKYGIQSVKSVTHVMRFVYKIITTQLKNETN
jgi:hypothetical protein